MKISRWIKQLSLAIFKGQSDDGESPDTIINNIDRLLRRAALETDNSSLHDEIMKEIKDNTTT